MFVKLAHFLHIMLYALVAGVMWGTWLSLGRTMTEYDAATFLDDGKHMIANLATVMPVLMISTGVVSLIVVMLLFRHGATTPVLLALAALVALAAVIAVTLAVEVPIDNKIKTWTTASLPADWEQIRSRWANFHTLRTFLSLAGLAAAVAASLARQRPLPAAPLPPSGRSHEHIVDPPGTGAVERPSAR